MTVMTTTGLPYARRLTVDDLEQLPDDGHRYELLDGTLLVGPAPAWSHQEVEGELFVRLRGLCPHDLRVLAAPFAVQLDHWTELQPDILVARYADFTWKNLPVAPLLAVEVLSPSTKLVDLNLKRAAYERYGVSSYWMLDPDPSEPELTVLELDLGGRYLEVARARGAEPVQVERPFRATLVPAELAAGLHPR